MDNLFYIGLLLLIGYLAGMLSDRLRLPKISGYILVGITLSPSLTHLLPASFLSDTDTIVHFALSVIAFMIGGSLKFEKVKKLEKNILGVMIGESETAFVFVTLGLYLCLPWFDLQNLAMEGSKTYLLVSLFLGAISAATAPAAVLAVIHQYRAKGPFTTTLLGVVATDDAMALINFTLVLSVASLIQGKSGGTGLMMLAEPFITIGGSLLLGVSVGWLYARYLETIDVDSGLSIPTFGMLILMYVSSEHFALDGLLACMAFGITLINTTAKAEEIFRVIQEHFEEIIFVLFFIISGASVELGILADVWPVALLYVTFRIVGKVLGSRFGATVSDADSSVKKYVGMALIPQAGVAIGLSLTLYHHPDFGEIGLLVLNTVIAATAINEIIGPVLLRTALHKAGEIEERMKK